MSKRSHYNPNRKPIPYHTHVARILPETNHVYGYCKVCGCAMSKVKVQDMRKLLEAMKVEVKGEELNTPIEGHTIRDTLENLRNLDQETPSYFQGTITKMADELLGVVDSDVVRPSIAA